MAKKHDIIEIQGHLHFSTNSAHQFSTDGEKKVWLPKQFCEWDGPETGAGEMQMPEWMALEKGLI